MLEAVLLVGNRQQCAVTFVGEPEGGGRTVPEPNVHDPSLALQGDHLAGVGVMWHECGCTVVHRRDVCVFSCVLYGVQGWFTSGWRCSMGRFDVGMCYRCDPPPPCGWV